MPSIAGRFVLIIGGSSGIGAAVAQLSAAQGVSVAIASSNSARVEAAVKKIQTAILNSDITGYTCDLNQDDVESRLEKLLSSVTADAGRPLDHIVYTAGVFNIKPVADVTLDYLRTSGQFTFYVPLLLAKLAPRFLTKSYTSSLTFTGGRIGEKPMKGATVGTGWIAALAGITRSLALDLAPIRVNLVSPGTTNTEMHGEDRGEKMTMVANMSLLGKVGKPEEVAEAYIYLMKDSNNTGTCVSTSGGVLVQ